MNFYQNCNFSTVCKKSLSYFCLIFLIFVGIRPATAQVCPVDISGDLAFCPGETASLSATAGFANYDWSNGSTSQNINVTAAGTYCVTATDGMGCANFSCATVTALTSPVTTLFETICEGDAFLFDDSFYDVDGTYQATYTAANGCDSIVVLNLNVEEAILFPLTAVICQGESLEVGDSVYTEPGFYFNLFTSAAGCDSLVFVELTVGTDVTTTLVETICEGEAYTVGNSSYTQTGSYTDVLPSFANCDSTVNLTLTVLESPETFLTERICEGESIQFGDMSLDQSGSFELVLPAANGCDSTITLDLTVDPTYQVSLVETICSNESFDVGAESFSVSGSYEVTLTTTEGCDSLISLDLTVLPAAESALEAFICPGSSINVGQESFDETGEYEVVLTAANGCDSSIFLTLNVLEEFETTAADVICAGSTYEIGGMTFTDPGEYVVTLTASNGCDSMVNLVLTEADPIEVDLTDQFCGGGEYEIGGMIFTEAGEYEVILTAANGCDSMVNLTLEESDLLVSEVSMAICDGEAIEVGGMIFSEPGEFEVNLLSQFGCDSMINLTVNLGESSDTALDLEICEGELVTIGDETFSESGSYEVTLTNSTGCDSLVRLDLLVNETTTSDLSASICAGESIVIGGEEFNASGNYVVEEIDDNGCTNITNLSLVVFPTSSTIEDVLCPGESLLVNGTLYDEANPSGTEVIPNGSMVFNCDSLIIVELTFSPEIVVDDVLIVNEDGSGNGSITPTISGGSGDLEYEWSNGETTLAIDGLSMGSYTLVVVDENGCVEIFSFFVDMETSIDAAPDFKEAATVYPNPAKDLIMVELQNNTAGEKQFYLYDILGQVVQSAAFEGEKLEVEMPAISGSYFYSIEAKDGQLIAVWKGYALIRYPINRIGRPLPSNSIGQFLLVL